MAQLKTYYDTLQLARSASPAVIRAAYRSLSQQYHPDKNPGDLEKAHRYMSRLNKAYEVLSDPDRRKAYDDEIDASEEELQSKEKRADSVGDSVAAKSSGSGWNADNKYQEAASFRQDANSPSASTDDPRYRKVPSAPQYTDQQSTAAPSKSPLPLFVTVAALAGLLFFLSQFGTVLLIAFVPAAAVFATGVITKSRGQTIAAAIVAATLSAWLGDKSYLFLDLAAVAIGYLGARSSFRPPPTPKVAPAAVSPSKTGHYWIYWLAALGFIGMTISPHFTKSPTPKVPTISNVQTVQKQAPATASSVTSNPAQAPTPANKKPPTKYDATLLDIEGRNPRLNPNSSDYDAQFASKVFARKDQLVKRGTMPEVAIAQAVDEANRRIKRNAGDSDLGSQKNLNSANHPRCFYKSVMSDDDYKNCGLSPPVVR